jgi:predicted transcriptional regulator
MSTGKRRSSGQLARDRRRIANLYLQGWLQADIAVELGISPATVSRDLKALQGEWRQSSLIDIDAAKSKELAKVDRLEREYWTAWERSCQDAETVTQKTKGTVQRRQNEDGTFVSEQPAEAAKTTKGQAGDPRFLNGVQWCIERRCTILGIDAPREVDVKSGGEKVQAAVVYLPDNGRE